MSANTMTKAQQLAFLHTADADYCVASNADPSLYFDAWMEIGRCIRDLDSARCSPINTAARSAVIRRGLVHQNLYGRDRHGSALRFELTPTGDALVQELTAATSLIRALCRLPWWN